MHFERRCFLSPRLRITLSTYDHSLYVLVAIPIPYYSFLSYLLFYLKYLIESRYSNKNKGLNEKYDRQYGHKTVAIDLDRPFRLPTPCPSCLNRGLVKC